MRGGMGLWLGTKWLIACLCYSRYEALLRQGESLMLYTLIGLMLFFWVLGVVAKVGGAFIHLLLAIAVVLFMVQLLTSHRVER